VLMTTYDKVGRATKPPRFLQQLVMWTLAPLGRLAGYHSTHT
jgi:hypothetical protein